MFSVNKTMGCAAAAVLLATGAYVYNANNNDEPKTSTEMMEKKPLDKMTPEELAKFNNMRFIESCKAAGIDPNAPDAAEQCLQKQRDEIIKSDSAIIQEIKAITDTIGSTIPNQLYKQWRATR